MPQIISLSFKNVFNALRYILFLIVAIQILSSHHAFSSDELERDTNKNSKDFKKYYIDDLAITIPARWNNNFSYGSISFPRQNNGLVKLYDDKFKDETKSDEEFEFARLVWLDFF